MRYQILGIASIVLSFISLPAAANDIVHLPFKAAVERAVAEGVLDGSVSFHLAGTAKSGTVIQAGIVTNKKTNAFNKSDEEACEHVLRSALIQLQSAAKQKNATSVRNVVSYFKKETFQSTTDYECHVSTAVAGVALKGDLVR